MNYCHFCDVTFVSGRACGDIKQRDKCAEWAAAKMAECDYRNGRKDLGEVIPAHVGGSGT